MDDSGVRDFQAFGEVQNGEIGERVRQDVQRGVGQSPAARQVQAFQFLAVFDQIGNAFVGEFVAFSEFQLFQVRAHFGEGFQASIGDFFAEVQLLVFSIDSFEASDSTQSNGFGEVLREMGTTTCQKNQCPQVAWNGNVIQEEALFAQLKRGVLQASLDEIGSGLGQFGIKALVEDVTERLLDDIPQFLQRRFVLWRRQLLDWCRPAFGPFRQRQLDKVESFHHVLQARLATESMALKMGLLQPNLGGQVNQVHVFLLANLCREIHAQFERTIHDFVRFFQ